MRVWLREWWLRVPEPREVSIGWGVAYLALAFAGLAAVMDPPRTIVAEVSGPAMAAIGVLNLVGAVIAMTAGYLDFWKLERVGILFMAGAAGIYALLVLAIHFSTEGPRLMQFWYLAFALVVLGVRTLMIWRFSHRPRG